MIQSNDKSPTGDWSSYIAHSCKCQSSNLGYNDLFQQLKYEGFSVAVLRLVHGLVSSDNLDILL